jgi:hypothetical protein
MTLMQGLITGFFRGYLTSNASLGRKKAKKNKKVDNKLKAA